MDFTEALAELADIHTPGDVSWWPLGPGWWMLLGLLLMLGAWGFWVLQKRMVRQRRLGAALAEVSRARQQLQAAGEQDMANRLVYVNEINAVLRRVALLHNEHDQVAGLSGQAWVNFLREHDRDGLLDDQLAGILAQGRFARSCDVDAVALERMACAWIKNMYMARIEPKTKTETNAAAEQHA